MEVDVKRILAAVSIVSMCIGASSASAQLSSPLLLSVNCGSGGVIQTQIDNATLARPVEISVTGTCTENVSIKRDHVTIRGNVPGTKSATIKGEIKISGAQNVKLLDLIVKRQAGPAANGVSVGNGAEVRIENITSTTHKLSALVVARNATVWVDKSSFIGSTISRETIIVVDGGHLRFERSLARASKVDDFDGFVLGLYRNATARLGNNARLQHTNNPLSANEWEGAAVVAHDSSVFRLHHDGAANTVTGNVVMSDASAGDIRNSNIAGNVFSHRQSLIEFRNSTAVTGNVRSGTRSMVDYKGASQTGTASCFQEGALKGKPAGVTETGCVLF